MILVQDYGEHPLVEELYVKANNDGRMEEWMEEWMDGWMDGWIDGWMNG